MLKLVFWVFLLSLPSFIIGLILEYFEISIVPILFSNIIWIVILGGIATLISTYIFTDKSDGISFILAYFPAIFSALLIISLLIGFIETKLFYLLFEHLIPIYIRKSCEIQ